MASVVDRLRILNFRRLSPTITTSGQPTEDQLAALAAAGVVAIINLARPDSPGALPDEAGSLAALGVAYLPIPVDFAAPTEADYHAFVAAIENVGTAPMHVHCAANYRVSAFFYRYRRERLGWSEATARPDLDAIWTPDAVWQAFLTGS